MASPETSNSDDPLTPAGRLFVHPQMNTIIHCILGVANPFDIDAVKATVKDSLLLKHPRFCSLLVKDQNGLEHWRRTHVDIDRHVIIIREKGLSENEYLADLAVSSPLSLDKPLWEIHLLLEQRCAVFRIHHALGDGISLVSMLLASCRRLDDPTAVARLPAAGGGGERRSLSILGMIKMVFLSFMYMFEFVVRALWVCDKQTVVSGGAGVELWPRKVATARFCLEDMKIVKRAVDRATINDVLFGIISSGLSRYLDHRSPNALKEGVRLTGLAMVNIRAQPGLQDVNEMMKSNPGSRWGNKFGMMLLPVYYHKGGDPLEYLKRAKAMIDRKKLSLEAYLSYAIGNFIMSLFGPKYASLLNYRIVCNTTFTISNVVGPQEEITIVNNPVTYLRANTTSLPHALTMHMMSYAGKADLQLLVAKDIIPDPEFLAKCFEDALLEMKEAAQATSKT